MMTLMSLINWQPSTVQIRKYITSEQV